LAHNLSYTRLSIALGLGEVTLQNFSTWRATRQTWQFMYSFGGLHP